MCWLHVMARVYQIVKAARIIGARGVIVNFSDICYDRYDWSHTL